MSDARSRPADSPLPMAEPSNPDAKVSVQRPTVLRADAAAAQETSDSQARDYSASATGEADDRAVVDESVDVGVIDGARVGAPSRSVAGSSDTTTLRSVSVSAPTSVASVSPADKSVHVETTDIGQADERNAAEAQMQNESQTASVATAGSASSSDDASADTAAQGLEAISDERPAVSADCPEDPTIATRFDGSDEDDVKPEVDASTSASAGAKPVGEPDSTLSVSGTSQAQVGSSERDPSPPSTSFIRSLALLPLTWPLRAANSVPGARRLVPSAVKPAPLITRSRLAKPLAFAHASVEVVLALVMTWLAWLRGLLPRTLVRPRWSRRKQA